MLRRSLIELDRRRKNPDESQKGFTLIELLVVIIIIGILAAIAIPVFLNQRQSAWQASVGSDLKNAAVVVETYGTKNNGSYASFPGAGTAVVNTDGTITGAAATGGTADLKVSNGNTITVTLVSTGSIVTSYKIVGSNSNIPITGTAGAGTQTYDPSAGGLGKFK